MSSSSLSKNPTVVTSVEELTKWRRECRSQELALVPTMGALHQGHLSLVSQAANHADLVAVSIFVNPLQFNNASDLDKYPRSLRTDLEQLRVAGVDLVFAPGEADLFSPSFCSQASVSILTKTLEGAHRPGHFVGVTTIVSILFNLFQPQFAVFGEKDFQQLRVIEQLVADLCFPVKIVRAPLVREASGLALSSRNQRLSDSGRERAALISSALKDAVEQFKEASSRGDYSASYTKDKLVSDLTKFLPDSVIDYVEIVDETTLRPHPLATRVVLAITIDGIRLIDTINLAAPNL